MFVCIFSNFFCIFLLYLLLYLFIVSFIVSFFLTLFYLFFNFLSFFSMTTALHSQTSTWGLSQDTQLFDFLRSFSLSLVSHTMSLETELGEMVSEARKAEVRLNNVFNSFLLLSNEQFVEHRVFEEEEVSVEKKEEKVGNGNEIGNGEEEAVENFRQGLALGMKALETFAVPVSDWKEVGIDDAQKGSIAALAFVTTKDVCIW